MWAVVRGRAEEFLATHVTTSHWEGGREYLKVLDLYDGAQV